MPNWCMNKLQLECTRAQFKQFCDVFVVDEDEDTVLSLKTACPEPPGLLEPELVTTPKWYTWRIANWGTKWEPAIHDITGTTVSFDSAWSPPINAVIAMSKRFPDILFKLAYCEPDNELSGRMQLKSGIIICESSSDSNDGTHEQMLAEFGVED